MTSEKSLEKLLENVDESRRDFVRKAIWGTMFAAPILASFSMEGGIIDNAEAFVPNQCSNMAYGVPDEYDAQLRPNAPPPVYTDPYDPPSLKVKGESHFTLTSNGLELFYWIKINRFDTLGLNYITIWLLIDGDNAITFGSPSDFDTDKGVIKGVINQSIFNKDDIKNGFCFNTLLQGMADGYGTVYVQFNFEDSPSELFFISGDIVVENE